MSGFRTSAEPAPGSTPGVVPFCDILIVDDDAPLRSALSQYLERFGYVVRCAKDGKVALDLLGRLEARLIITDIFMPELDGFELIQHLRKKSSPAKILAISGDGLPEQDVFMAAARHLGVRHTLMKPFSLVELLASVRDALGEVPVSASPLGVSVEA